MRSRGTLGVVVVVVVVVMQAILGEDGGWLAGAIGALGLGLFAATATFSSFAYRERKDPALLLVGVGAAAYTLHVLALRVAIDVARSSTWLGDLYGYGGHTGLLVLVANLLVVVPWVDRRGRTPLDPRRVVAASVAGLIGLDLLVALSSGGRPVLDLPAPGDLPALAWLISGALVVTGVIVTVRCLRWGGRFGWVAAAGLAAAFFGAATMLSPVADSDHAVAALITIATSTPALAAASLVVFVVLSLQLESTRMRRATDRAEEVLTGRAEIAAMVAHDVRGPLGTMKGLATTVRKSYDRLGDEERLEFIGMIERESTRLLALVEHISLALRVDAGTLDMTIRPQPLARLVHRAVEVADLEPHPIEVGVPDDLTAPVDAKWLPVAIGEALDNAARFSPPDAPIRVRVGAEATRTVIEVEDHGPGVPAERRDEVFTRFARWRPPGYEDRPGSGLGLFICRGIALAHGGDASIADAPGGGTILRIELPMEGTGSG